MPEQALRMKDGRKLRANAPDADERLQRRRQTRRLLGDKRIPFSLYCLDLLQHQLETIEFSGDLRLNVRGDSPVRSPSRRDRRSRRKGAEIVIRSLEIKRL